MAEIRNVDVVEAARLAQGGALLLDVRQDDEWDAGHAPDARHVMLAELPDHVGSLDADRLIVCVCRSGGRSARATAFLMEQGFDVVNLAGGMTAWAQEGQPLTSESGDPTVI
jgi:rhodanese-related sulfurtransferase